MTDSVPQVDDYAASVGTTGRVTVGSATGEIGGTPAADTLAGTAGADAIDGLAGNDTVRGLGGDDRLWGRQGADTLYGNAGNDRLWGGRDGDELHGGVGKDHLYGGLGHDTLYGGRGDDTLHGGRLADRLHGGEGKDVLAGGHGRDLFVYDDADFGRDRIVDFEDGLDRLDFTGSGLRWSDLSVSNNGKGDAVVRVDGANGKIVLEGVDASLIGQDDFIFPETPATAMTPPVVARAPVFGQQGYAFPLAENADGSGSRVALGTVSATDPEGSTVSYSIAGGNAAGLFEIDASTGALYYTGSGEDYEAGPTSRELTVRASDGALHADVTVTVALADAAEAPVFGQQGYAFSLAENADGSGSRVALGTVSATDPEGSTVSYSIAGGNAAGLFEIDASTGALYYTGSGEDYEAGPTSRELTVRASDGALHADVTVTVALADAAEAPVFGQQGYAFSLAENADGSGSRVALGTVSATDPEGSTVSYSIAGGNAAGLFEIDASTGALYYTGSGEDYEAGPTSRELTVRASDGALHADVTVTVALADAAEAPVFGQQGYAFSLAENADGSGSRVALGTVSATDPEGSTVSYSIAGGNAAGLFEIDASTGALYYTGSGEDYEAGPASRELTIRASDGALHADVTVTVTVTDVEEEAVTPARAPQQSVSEAAGEDLPADSTTTGVVAVDGAATGNIGIQGDRDWFAVEFAAGRSYQIDLKGRSTGDGTLRDPELFGIHDAEGNLISGTTDSNGGEGRNSRETFTATESGTHYIAAGGRAVWAGPGYGQGTYEVAVTDLGQNRSEAAGEDLPAGSTTTGVVVVGGEATGKIGRAGDRDWFAVEFEAGRTYDIVLKGSPTGDGTLHDPHLFGIHDVDGNLVPRTTSGSGGFTANYNSRVIFTAGETDTHYIEAGGFRNYWGTYTLAVADITDEYPDDFAHTTTTTGTVSVGGSVTGEFQWIPFRYARSDGDWFAVEFEEGKTYRIDLEGASTNAGTVPNPYISGVFDADGNLLYDSTDFNGGEGLNSRLIFTAGETATHYISARAYRDEGTYKLSVTDISDQVTDDFAFGTGTSGTVSVDGSVTGKIERARDQDWFAVELEAGKTYRVDLEGVWSDVGTLPDPYLRGIFDSDGVLIPGTSDDDSGFKDNSRVTFTATETGTHYVAASAFRVSHRETEYNAYRLSVYDVTDGGGPDEFTAGTDTTGRVSVGGSATGLIGYVGDRDWFAVELVAGETYRIDLKGWEADGWLIDPYLHGIHDAAGNLISGTEDDNGGAQLNSRVKFEPTQTGTYYIEAGSGPWKSHAYGEGTYTLSVELWDALSVELWDAF